jgi:hypothetical protein
MVRRSLAVLLIAAVAGGVLGCGEKAEQHAEAAKSHVDAAMDHGTAEVSAQVVALLAKADAVDGKVDHVVSQCSGCKLKMAGSPDHALQVGDYTMRFCSTGCQEHFAEGTEEAILAMEIPDAGDHDGHGH